MKKRRRYNGKEEIIQRKLSDLNKERLRKGGEEEVGENRSRKWMKMKWRTEGFSGHTYVASMTTPTPVGCRASVIATAICLVNLS